MGREKGEPGVDHFLHRKLMKGTGRLLDKFLERVVVHSKTVEYLGVLATVSNLRAFLMGGTGEDTSSGLIQSPHLGLTLSQRLN